MSRSRSTLFRSVSLRSPQVKKPLDHLKDFLVRLTQIKRAKKCAFDYGDAQISVQLNVEFYGCFFKVARIKAQFAVVGLC